MKNLLAALLVTVAVTSAHAITTERWAGVAHITAAVDGKDVDVTAPMIYNKATWDDEDACKAAIEIDPVKTAINGLRAQVAAYNAEHGVELKVAFVCEKYNAPGSDQSKADAE